MQSRFIFKAGRNRILDKKERSLLSNLSSGDQDSFLYFHCKKAAYVIGMLVGAGRANFQPLHRVPEGCLAHLCKVGCRASSPWFTPPVSLPLTQVQSAPSAPRGSCHQILQELPLGPTRMGRCAVLPSEVKSLPAAVGFSNGHGLANIYQTFAFLYPCELPSSPLKS